MAVAYPVVYLAVPDWVVDAIAGACCCRQSLVSNEEVQVFGTTLPREMSARSSTTSQKGGFVRNCWTTGARTTATARWAFRSYRRGEDERGRIVTRETYEGVLLLVELKLLHVVVPSFE
jgi:hypothetical protein